MREYLIAIVRNYSYLIHEIPHSVWCIGKKVQFKMGILEGRWGRSVLRRMMRCEGLLRGSLYVRPQLGGLSRLMRGQHLLQLAWEYPPSQLPLFLLFPYRLEQAPYKEKGMWKMWLPMYSQDEWENKNSNEEQDAENNNRIESPRKVRN